MKAKKATLKNNIIALLGVTEIPSEKFFDQIMIKNHSVATKSAYLIDAKLVKSRARANMWLIRDIT
jgi:hypothetical protein